MAQRRKVSKKTMAEAVYMGIMAAETGVKHVRILFIEMTLTNVVLQGLMDRVIQKSYTRWTQLEILVKKVRQKTCKHPALLQKTSLQVHGSNFDEIH